MDGRLRLQSRGCPEGLDRNDGLFVPGCWFCINHVSLPRTHRGPSCTNVYCWLIRRSRHPWPNASSSKILYSLHADWWGWCVWKHLLLICCIRRRSATHRFDQNLLFTAWNWEAELGQKMTCGKWAVLTWAANEVTSSWAKPFPNKIKVHAPQFGTQPYGVSLMNLELDSEEEAIKPGVGVVTWDPAEWRKDELII